jgi:hypothetical protein
MLTLPRRLPGSKQELSDQLVVSILIDRSLVLECGKAVLVLVTAEEAAALYTYLRKHSNKFQIGGKQ